MNKIASLAFSSDGRYLVSGSFDNTIKIWSMGSGNLVKTIYRKNFFKLDSIENIKIDKNIDVNSQEINSFIKDITNVKVAIKNDKYIAFGYTNGEIKIFNLKTKEENRVFNLKQKIKVKSITFNKKKYEINEHQNFDEINQKLQNADNYKIEFNNKEWIKIDKTGHFASSKNASRYINILTSPLNATTIIPFYYKFYKPEFISNNPIFLDNFLDNRYEWSLDKNSIVEFEIKNKKFLFNHLNDGSAYRILKYIDTNKNIRIDISLAHISGKNSGHGIMWSDGEYKYIFSIAKTYFLVSKFNKLKYEIINRWTKSDYINSKNNVLSIEKRGNSINLFINGFEVYSFHSLYNYLESVGFIVDSRQLVWFDYLKVLSLDEYNDTVFKDINESFDKN